MSSAYTRSMLVLSFVTDESDMVSFAPGSTPTLFFLIIASFDQARLIRQNRILAENGIDPSGMFVITEHTDISS